MRPKDIYTDFPSKLLAELGISKLSLQIFYVSLDGDINLQDLESVQAFENVCREGGQQVVTQVPEYNKEST